MEDQQLMFDQDGLGNYGTDAARPRQSATVVTRWMKRIARSRISGW